MRKTFNIITQYRGILQKGKVNRYQGSVPVDDNMISQILPLGNNTDEKRDFHNFSDSNPTLNVQYLRSTLRNKYRWLAPIKRLRCMITTFHSIARNFTVSIKAFKETISVAYLVIAHFRLKTRNRCCFMYYLPVFL